MRIQMRIGKTLEETRQRVTQKTTPHQHTRAEAGSSVWSQRVRGPPTRRVFVNPSWVR